MMSVAHTSPEFDLPEGVTFRAGDYLAMYDVAFMTSVHGEI